MKALILVGGFGTRLRPLTLSVPKPVVEFANKAMVLHQIEALAKVGVKTVILAINYKPEAMMSILEPFEKKLGVKIICSQETEPLGTAGPIALAKKWLDDGSGESFFVLNSDVICEYPFPKLIEFHKKHGKEGTIFVTKVEEPSKYGVVISDPETGKIDSFKEKPKEFVSNKINAGLYLFTPGIISRIPLRPTSIEKEVFPEMCRHGELYALELPGFWMDVGQPPDFLTGMGLYLNAMLQRGGEDRGKLASGASFIPPVLVDPSAKIGNHCVIGPNVTIGPNCVVEDGVRLSECSILEGVVIKSNSWIHKSIIGWQSYVGRWVRIEGVSVLGQDVQIQDELYLNGAVILPHKSITASIPEPKVVM